MSHPLRMSHEGTLLSHLSPERHSKCLTEHSHNRCHLVQNISSQLSRHLTELDTWKAVTHLALGPCSRPLFAFCILHSESPLQPACLVSVTLSLSHLDSHTCPHQALLGEVPVATLHPRPPSLPPTPSPIAELLQKAFLPL